MAAVFLAVAGALTHFAVGAGRISVADQRLMPMQRMGPPADLQSAYAELSADTVRVRNPATGHQIATGMFVGTVSVNPSLPGVTSILPGSFRRILGALKGPAFAAVFVVPLVQDLLAKVMVTLAGKALPGAISYQNSALDLAAVNVLVSQDELGSLLGPPIFFHQPVQSRTVLRRLIVYLGPERGRAAGYVFTPGIFHPTGRSQCGASISRTDPGSPVGWVSLQGTLVLAGLAVPSGPSGRCEIIGSWSIGEFLQFMVAQRTPEAGAFLGVVVHGNAVPRQLASGQRVHGAYIASVVPGSPSAQAGLREGDVVVRLDGAAVRSGDALVAEIRSLRPGTLHSIVFIRDRRLRRARVELAREGS